MSEASNTSGLDAFRAALARYVIWSGKGQGPVVEDRARKLRFELFKVFKKIAKTPQGLREEISVHGFEFKRRLDPKTGKAVSPEREVDLRIRSLRYLSVSWIYAQWRARRDGQSGRFSAVSRGQKVIGEAIVSTSEGTASPYVELTSYLEGVMAQNSKRKLLDAALANQAADMAVYIARKHQEWLAAQLGRGFEVTGTVTLA